MVGRFLVKMLRKAVARPLYRKFARFEAACQNPQATQDELLRRIQDIRTSERRQAPARESTRAASIGWPARVRPFRSCHGCQAASPDRAFRSSPRPDRCSWCRFDAGPLDTPSI